MIRINNRDLDALANQHWKHVEEHFRHYTNKVKFGEIAAFCRQIEPGFSFENLIKARAEKLQELKENYPAIVRLNNYQSCSDKLRAVYNHSFSLADKMLGSKGYNAIQFVEQLEITVCPYCNRNYIDTRSYKNVKKAGCQIDHFYDKYTFPLFSLCFYNLIPVCPSCNHTKHTKQFSISPYDETIETDLVTFGWEPQNGDYLQSKRDIKLTFQCCNEEMEQQFAELKLELPYTMHTDIAYEIIKKVRLYDHYKMSEYQGDYPDLTWSKEETVQILFGLSPEATDHLKRPLSKLTRDILSIEMDKWQK
ncbi:hypothetical protein [Paenibacillus cymbidii]|uniref:hypothetical protein n=1 Tax=Paenibacillus cymbidii TaxID=1639034 RepID=UPI001081C551|nr:hypothetical protein [Paenibacillus cymbidii]